MWNPELPTPAPPYSRGFWDGSSHITCSTGRDGAWPALTPEPPRRWSRHRAGTATCLSDKQQVDGQAEGDTWAHLNFTVTV